jgi:hypothetical protein
MANCTGFSPSIWHVIESAGLQLGMAEGKKKPRPRGAGWVTRRLPSLALFTVARWRRNSSHLVQGRGLQYDAQQNAPARCRLAAERGHLVQSLVVGWPVGFEERAGRQPERRRVFVHGGS